MTTRQTYASDSSDKALALFFQDIASIPLLSAEQEKELAAHVAKGDEEARHRFIEANLRLVVSIAKRYQRDTVPLEDLIQEGVFGLIYALDKFDGRGRFSTYAVWWIRQAILRSISELERPIRIPLRALEAKNALRGLASQIKAETGKVPTSAELARRSGKSLKRVLFLQEIDGTVFSIDDLVKDIEGDATFAQALIDRNSPDPQDEFEIAEEASLLRQALSTLSSREEEILRRRHGIDCSPQTLIEVARDMGVSTERVRQIETKARSALLMQIRQMQV